MKTKRLIATNGEFMICTEEVAAWFLSRHTEDKPDQMKWTELKEDGKIRVTVDWVEGLIEQLPRKEKTGYQVTHVIRWLNEIGIGIDCEDNLK